jgi:hypothetical protein
MQQNAHFNVPKPTFDVERTLTAGDKLAREIGAAPEFQFLTR